jgi:Arc/MetJ-type ribon-helix-helix transcriptional regulator
MIRESVRHMEDCELVAIKQNKVKISATISPYLRKRIEEYLKSDEFSSLSDFVSIAAAELIGKLDNEKEMKKAEADAEMKKRQSESLDAAALLIKLLTKHPELLSEIQEERKEEKEGKPKSATYKIPFYVE